MTFYSAALTLFLIIDPLGNVPIFLALLKDLDERRQRWVIFRESLIALAILVFFWAVGPAVLGLMRLDPPALEAAGGVILFLIALRMIFPPRGGMFGDELVKGEPLVVPLATPLFAGPSAMATVMLMTTRQPDLKGQWLAALAVAWAVSAAILLASAEIKRLLGERLLIAVERLMGMILTVVAVQMLMNGFRGYLH